MLHNTWFYVSLGIYAFAAFDVYDGGLLDALLWPLNAILKLLMLPFTTDDDVSY